VASSAPAAPAPSADPSDQTMFMAPGQAPSAPQEDRTMVISPGEAASMTAAARAPLPVDVSTPGGAAPPAPPAAKPVAAKPVAAKPPASPPPPPKAAAPAPKPQPAKPAASATSGKKSGLPIPALAGVGALVVAIIVVAVMLMNKPKTETPTEVPEQSTQQVEPPPVAAPVVTTAAPTESTTSALPLFEQARRSFAAGDYVATVRLGRQAMTAKETSRKDQRAAQELVARSLVRQNRTADATLVYQALLKATPTFKPDPTGLTKAETAAFEAARTAPLATTPVVETPTAAPTPPASGGTATLTVTVSPFAEAFIVDGETKDRNKQTLRVQLKAGKHTVRVTHPSLGSKDLTVDLQGGESKQISHDFLAASAGSLSVSSAGGWAEIYIDGDPTGKTTPALIEGVLPGKRSISLVRDGYTIEGGPQTVDVKAGHKASVQFKLKPKK